MVMLIPTCTITARVICGHGMLRLSIGGLTLQGLLVCVIDRLRSSKENGRNRIAGAGMHVQLVIAGEEVIVTCPSW